MLITGLHIDRFGIWSDLKMENMPEGMTVFFGPNEAGKSTLMQYVRTMLYGFHPIRCARFAAERRKHGTLIQPAGRLGGSLFVATRDGEYHIRRYANELDPLGDPGEVRITTQDGRRHGAQRLSTLLAGMDDTIFHNVFAVGLQEMQAIGALNDTDAARQLFSLSTGADRVSLVDITRQLQATRGRLVGGDDRQSLLAEIVAQQNRLQTQIGQLASQTERWASLVAERDGLEDEIARLEAASGSSNRRADVVEMAMRVQPKWDELRRLGRELELLGPAHEVAEKVRASIQSLQAEIENHQQRQLGIEQRRGELQQELDQLAINDAMFRHSARITALRDQRATIAAIDERVSRLAGEVAEAEFEIQAEQERLGLANAFRDEAKSKPASRVLLPRLDTVAVISLQQPALALERQRDLLEVTNNEAASYKEDAQRISREIAIALGRDSDWFEKNDREDIRVALEATSGTADGIRRHIEIEQQIQQLQGRLGDVEDRRAGVLRSQLLPWDVVRALGALFALGAVLFFCGLFGQSFGWSEQTRGVLLLMGIVGVGLAGLLKLTLDSPARDGLRDAERQSELLKKQLADLEAERDELDRKLPDRRSGGDSLTDTRKELVRLEALMPLEEQRRSILHMAEQAERRAVEIAKSMKEARRQWEDALDGRGLSRKLTPAQLKALAGQSGSLGTLHRVLEDRQLEWDQATREQQVVLERVRDVLADVMLRPASELASEQLEQLGQAQELQAQLQQQREKIRNEDRQLKRDQQSELRSIKQLTRRREMQIASTGALDESDLSRMEQRSQRRHELELMRQQLQREIDSLFANRDDEEVVQSELQGSSGEPLPAKLKRVQDEINQAVTRLQQLQYRQGELDEQIRQLAADKSLGKAHLDVGVLEHQLEDGLRRWQIVSAMSGMLKTVYKKYEKERQPDTLQEASQYLERMTGGRYGRIWTPLAEDVLLVDDPDGRSFPVEVLSRGTREQLFLSLRLALIACYARRGIKMPLVLDDVLVNFDLERTEAAAAVLADFARSGYQILVFTCHQHIREVFQQLQVDVRELPRHGSRTDEIPATALPTEDLAERGPGADLRPQPTVVLGYAEGQYNTLLDTDPSRGVNPSRGVSVPAIPAPAASDSTLLGFWESPVAEPCTETVPAESAVWRGWEATADPVVESELPRPAARPAPRRGFRSEMDGPGSEDTPVDLRRGVETSLEFDDQVAPVVESESTAPSKDDMGPSSRRRATQATSSPAAESPIVPKRETLEPADQDAAVGAPEVVEEHTMERSPLLTEAAIDVRPRPVEEASSKAADAGLESQAKVVEPSGEVEPADDHVHLVEAAVSGNAEVGNSDEYEYEYEYVDVDEDGNEIAESDGGDDEVDEDDEDDYLEIGDAAEGAAGGDADLGDEEDEYEYEYEYVEVDADESAEDESDDTADESDEDEEDEYEDEEDDEGEVSGDDAAVEESDDDEEDDEDEVAGDDAAVKESVDDEEDEYEYIEDDEGETAGDDDVEYEYIEVDADEAEIADEDDADWEECDEPEENDEANAA